MTLSRLFDPSSVAVIGASRTERRIGHEVMANLNQGFTGDLYPVNPHAEEILGLRSYSSLSEISADVDLAVICIPAKMVIDVLRECGECGTNNVVIISAGFKETGEDGKAREEKLTKVAKDYRLNVVGPNSLGVISTKSGLNASFAEQMAPEGRVSFMSQSGAFCTAVLDWANESGLGFNGFVSLGNKAVLDEVDFMKEWDRDPDTDVILGYLEGINRGREFIDVTRKVTTSTPVIVVKSGRTEEGAKAVSSHTGTIAGSEVAYDTALDQGGAIRAENIEEMFDFATVLNQQPLPKGNQVGILTNTGGPGVMATDALEKYDLDLARLTDSTLANLDRMLSPLADHHNPVDLTGDADEQDYGQALRYMLEDESVDAVVALSAPAAIISYAKLAAIIAEAKSDYDKPILSCLMGSPLKGEARSHLEQAGIPNYFDPARAIRSLGALNSYRDIQNRSYASPKTYTVNRNSVKQIIDQAGSTREHQLGIDRINLLSDYGIPVVDSIIASSAQEAKQFASNRDSKIVMKVASPDISHKSEVGGVKIDISPDNAEQAYSNLLNEVRSNASHAAIDGVIVQPQIHGQELIIGIDRDPQFGPLLMFGLGGIYVEVLEDVAFRIPPVSPKEAEDMVTSIKSYPLLTGARGREPVDEQSVVDVICRVSQLVCDFPDIVEMDINPLYANSEGVVAVDFRLKVD